MIDTIVISSLLAGVATLAWLYPSTKTPRSMVNSIGRTAPSLLRKRYEQALETLNLSVEPEFVAGIKYGGFLCGLLIALLMLWVGNIPLMMLFAAVALFAWVYPDQWLRRKEEARLNELQQEFPVMVTLVRVYARASDLYQALYITRGALKGEMKRQVDILASELQVSPLKTALENFARRCNYPPITNFVSVVLFGITTGANVDHILDSFARRAYEARVNDIKRKIKAQPIIMSILPATMMFSLMILFIFPMFTSIIERIRGFL